jgi:hypothetical protein
MYIPSQMSLSRRKMSIALDSEDAVKSRQRNECL